MHTNAVRRRTDTHARLQQEVQRLSALYQYHNAPEVAPAHGLEYDDNVYPSSDKYPVIRERDAYDSPKYGFGGDNRPPRIIFGMKVRTFLLVASVMALIIVGAAVGGAVGGRQLRDQAQGYNMFMNQTSSNSPTATTSGSASSSTFTAATPTYEPLSDCPESNNTAYTSSYALRSSATNAKTTFTKYCDLSNPLILHGSATLAEAFVYSFSDCVELCAGYNYLHNDGNCTAAVYRPTGSRPANCWVGSTGSVTASSLNFTSGTDVALLSA
ncbi:hypothetical protein AC578_4603 [Lecanosticta acicola]|uniref:Apple domain-containing protein n=1 Tax=Lecanosticta acicola TaxID=111012 RepID=A0AAI8Z679_9PEZI|nr:hypothetical protein AC578_4603 [Lecanosticta acicola]